MEELKALLLTVTDKTYYIEADRNCKQEYIVYKDIYDKSICGDNRRQDAVTIAQVDLYIRNEYSPLVKALETAMKEAGLSYQLADVTFDEDAKMLRKIYEIEVI